MVVANKTRNVTCWFAEGERRQCEIANVVDFGNSCNSKRTEGMEGAVTGKPFKKGTRRRKLDGSPRGFIWRDEVECHDSGYLSRFFLEELSSRFTLSVRVCILLWTFALRNKNGQLVVAED